MKSRVAARWLRRVATAVPATSGEVLVISSENLFKLIQDFPDWGPVAFDMKYGIEDYETLRQEVRGHGGAVFSVPEGVGPYQVDVPLANAASGPLTPIEDYLQ